MLALRTGLAAGVPFRKGQRLVRAPADALAGGAGCVQGRLGAKIVNDATSLLALHFHRIDSYRAPLLSRPDYGIAATIVWEAGRGRR